MVVTTANTASNRLYAWEILTADGTLACVCRWGHHHTGADRDMDVRQCECPHDSALLLLGPEQAVCGDCGRSWRVEDKRA